MGRAALYVIALMTAALPAAGESADTSGRDAARTLGARGRDAYVAGDYVRAIELFRGAFSLFPAPTLSVYEARALARAGQLVGASEAYARTIALPVDEHSPAQFHGAVRSAKAELAELTPRIPKVVFHVEGPGATDPDLTLSMDGIPWSRRLLGVETPVNPGRHRVAARGPAGLQATRVFTVAEGESKRVEIALGGPPDSGPPLRPAARRERPPRDVRPSSSRRTAGYVAIGVGAAGLGTGILAGLLAATRHDDAEAQCPAHQCTPGTAGERSVEAFRTLRAVSTAGYVAGVLGFATGITLLVVVPPAAARGTAVTVHGRIGAGHAALGGTF